MEWIAGVLILASVVQAEICAKWSKPEIVGKLDTEIISEASGLAISRNYSDRLYHHNDSGDGGYFYVTRMDGSETQTVTVPKMNPKDVEDMSLGPCGSETCIFLGDIGDNDEKRKSIEIWLIKEEENFGETAKVVKNLKLTYPDRPHNAEAMAVHPGTGDIYVLTKEMDRKENPGLALLFKASINSKKFELVGEIDVPFLNSDLEVWGQIVTGMSFNADGRKLLFLTYQNAIEFDFGLAERSIDSRNWVEGSDFSRASLTYLQQEAITYSPDSKSFYYDSEFNPDEGDAYIYQVKCEERQEGMSI